LAGDVAESAAVYASDALNKVSTRMAYQAIQTFRDLHAWQMAIDLTLRAYDLAKRFPSTERFELSAQVRRSAVSIPSNVAEGQCCGKDGRYLNHIRIAQGSLGELETQLEIARRLCFITPQEYEGAEQLFRRTGQLLHGLARSVRRRRLQRAGTGLALLGLFAFLPALFFALG
jgi:four helix bundle protein